MHTLLIIIIISMAGLKIIREHFREGSQFMHARQTLLPPHPPEHGEVDHTVVSVGGQCTCGNIREED